MSTSSHFKILILDNEEDFCELLRELILDYANGHKYEIDYSVTARDALNKINQQQYDLLFVDIKLVGTLSGIDVIKAFKNKVIRPKIVVASAISKTQMNPIFRSEGVEELVDDYLEKDKLLPQVIFDILKRQLKVN